MVGKAGSLGGDAAAMALLWKALALVVACSGSVFGGEFGLWGLFVGLRACGVFGSCRDEAQGAVCGDEHSSTDVYVGPCQHPFRHSVRCCVVLILLTPQRATLR